MSKKENLKALLDEKNCRKGLLLVCVLRIVASCQLCMVDMYVDFHRAKNLSLWKDHQINQTVQYVNNSSCQNKNKHEL